MEKISTSLQAILSLYESPSRAVGVGTAWIKIHIKSTVLSWWPGDFRHICHTTNRSHQHLHMHLQTCWRRHTRIQYWRWRWLPLLAPKSWYGQAAPRSRCRNILREITHVTCLIKDEQALGQLEEDLANILGNAKESAPPKKKLFMLLKNHQQKLKREKLQDHPKGIPERNKGRFKMLKQLNMAEWNIRLITELASMQRLWEKCTEFMCLFLQTDQMQ